MKIIQAIPRRMRFEAAASSSVELCVAEWVSGSRYRPETTVFAEKGGAPLIEVDVFRLPPPRRLSSWQLARTIRRQVALRGYDLVVTQQHLSTAAKIAVVNRRTPVVLQTHNFIVSPQKTPRSLLSDRLKHWQFQSLSGITFVSEATLRQFEKDWPGVTVPRRVISNGVDFSSWHPADLRQKVVIVVGRTQETKGILEAAQGLAPFLEKEKDWRAVFILSEPERNPDYFSAIKSALAPVEDRVEILTRIPFSRVKQITESASISIVASKWEEPFGRTALEAHAGGAALISSGTGGLREISGDAALYLDEVSGDAVGAALLRLAGDEALRSKLSRDGMQRVRHHFPLAREAGEGAPDGIAPICERLDLFYEEVLDRHRKRHGRASAA